MTEQIVIFFQIVFIDLVLAGDNAIIIWNGCFSISSRSKKKNYILGHWGRCDF